VNEDDINQATAVAESYVRWAENAETADPRIVEVCKALLAVQGQGTPAPITPKLVAVFLEGKFREIAALANLELATAFSHGYCCSVGHAKGNCALYLLPEDRDELIEGEDPQQSALALDAAGLR
jgi:hypothetical protein